MSRRPGVGGPVRSEYADHISVKALLVTPRGFETVGAVVVGAKEYRDLLRACKEGKPFLGELCAFTNTQDARVASVTVYDAKKTAATLAVLE